MSETMPIGRFVNYYRELALNGRQAIDLKYQPANDRTVERMVTHPGATVTKLIMEIGKKRGVDELMAIAPILSAISVAAGNMFTVKAAGYVNHLNIWSCIIAPSGSNKSQPAADVFAPLLEMNRSFYKQYLDQMEIAKGQNKKGDIAALLRVVKAKQILICDSTPEARNQALIDNSHGLLLYADELSSFLGGIDRYSAGNDAAQLMSIHDGKDVQINRKTDALQCIQNPFLSIFGTIQPKLYCELLMTDNMVNSGFAQRILPFVPIVGKTPDFNRLGEINPELLEAWSRLLQKLYNVTEPVQLTLTPKAEAAYATFYDRMSTFISDDETQDAVKSFVSKMKIAVLKLAGLFTLTNFDYPGLASYDGKIHYADMKLAIDMALELTDNFESLYESTLKQDTILSKKATFEQMVYHWPQLANLETITGVLGVSQATAYRWLKKE